MSLQNNSNTNISGIILLEKFARYLSVAEMKYDIIRGTARETRPFLTDDSQAESGIMDLRDVTIAP